LAGVTRGLNSRVVVLWGIVAVLAVLIVALNLAAR
jgi:hypothetical protein